METQIQTIRECVSVVKLSSPPTTMSRWDSGCGRLCFWCRCWRWRGFCTRWRQGHPRRPATVIGIGVTAAIVWGLLVQRYPRGGPVGTRRDPAAGQISDGPRTGADVCHPGYRVCPLHRYADAGLQHPAPEGHHAGQCARADRRGAVLHGDRPGKGRHPHPGFSFRHVAVFAGGDAGCRRRDDPRRGALGASEDPEQDRRACRGTRSGTGACMSIRSGCRISNCPRTSSASCRGRPRPSAKSGRRSPRPKATSWPPTTSRRPPPSWRKIPWRCNCGPCRPSTASAPARPIRWSCSPSN